MIKVILLSSYVSYFVFLQTCGRGEGEAILTHFAGEEMEPSLGGGSDHTVLSQQVQSPGLAATSPSLLSASPFLHLAPSPSFLLANNLKLTGKFLRISTKNTRTSPVSPLSAV